MIISKSSVTKLPNFDRIYFTCDNYYVEVNDGERVIFERQNPCSDEWMDEKHLRIISILQTLESEILECTN